MDYTLSQKRIFKSQVLTIEKDRLKISIKDLNSSQTFYMLFEEIDITKIRNEKKFEIIFLSISLFFGLFFFINLFNPSNYEGDSTTIIPVLIFLLSGFLCSSFITFLYYRNNIIIPSTSGVIVLYKNIPDEKTVDNFLTILKESINHFLKEKYAKVDIDLPKEQQFNAYNYLRERDIISEDEYQDLKKKLKSGKEDFKSIGF
ncbi:hypothetical protein BBFL7_02268 [Flavobacteria bacterium BBFL7]|nr:hypothetical protein BBFL7_02268 [Flavobacteria bacterium BBFL7]